jgi:hypothetical protein
VDSLVQQVWLRGDVAGACLILEAPSADEEAVTTDVIHRNLRDQVVLGAP